MIAAGAVGCKLRLAGRRLQLEIVRDNLDVLIHVEAVWLVLCCTDTNLKRRVFWIVRVIKNQADAEDQAQRVEAIDVFGRSLSWHHEIGPMREQLWAAVR